LPQLPKIAKDCHKLNSIQSQGFSVSHELTNAGDFWQSWQFWQLH